MNKIEAIEKLNEECKFAKKSDAKKAYETVLQIIEDSIVNDGGFTINGFGSFHVVDKAARTAHNPKTGEPVEVPAKKAVKFKAAKGLNAKVN